MLQIIKFKSDVSVSAAKAERREADEELSLTDMLIYTHGNTEQFVDCFLIKHIRGFSFYLVFTFLVLQ